VATDCLASNNRTIGQCGVGFYASYDALRAAGIARKLLERDAGGHCPACDLRAKGWQRWHAAQAA
jgi:hypothetical protein